jgi:hypothetical protein
MTEIYLRNQPPPTETFDHKSFLLFLSSWIKPENYLELGVRDGIVFSEISRNCKKSTAVDMSEAKFEIPRNANFFLGTTDQFFQSLSQDTKFDLVFIDADHSHEQSLKDFMNAQKFVIDDGFIILHDTYPINESFLDNGLCSDAYKTPLYIKNFLINEFEVLTLPFHPGLTIVKKIKNDKQLIWM